MAATRWRAGLAGALALMVGACAGGSAEGPTSGSSSSGTRLATSHNAGRDCTGCHREFAIAGTVYKSDGTTPLSGATVRLTSAADGTGVVLSLTSDGSGNFRTSQAVGFGAGLYVDVVGTSGTRSAMQAAITSGACNSCHGTSKRITAS